MKNNTTKPIINIIYKLLIAVILIFGIFSIDKIFAEEQDLNVLEKLPSPKTVIAASLDSSENGEVVSKAIVLWKIYDIDEVIFPPEPYNIEVYKSTNSSDKKFVMTLQNKQEEWNRWENFGPDGAFIDKNVTIGDKVIYYIRYNNGSYFSSYGASNEITIEREEYESEKECNDEITLESSVEKRKVALNWEKCGQLTQYDIYCDGKHLETTFKDNYQDENVDYGKHQYKVVANQIDTEQLVENYNQGFLSIPTAQAQENEIFDEAIVNIENPYSKYYIIMGIILVLGFGLFFLSHSRKRIL